MRCRWRVSGAATGCLQVGDVPFWGAGQVHGWRMEAYNLLGTSAPRFAARKSTEESIEGGMRWLQMLDRLEEGRVVEEWWREGMTTEGWREARNRVRRFVGSMPE